MERKEITELKGKKKDGSTSPMDNMPLIHHAVNIHATWAEVIQENLGEVDRKH